MPTLREIFSNTADAIRSKTGKSEGIYPVDMASEIESIESGGGYKLEKMPSGAISSFNDGTDLPLNKLKVSIEPLQSGSGDPSPTNVRPISGWSAVNVYDTGKNLFDENSTTIANDKVKNDNGTEVSSSGACYTSSTTPVKPNTTYVLNGLPSTSNVSFRIYYLDANGNWLSRTNTINFNSQPYSFTTPNNCGGLQFQLGKANTDFSATQVELGSTSTTYEPYNGQTYTIQFKDGDNPLTVYGGSLDVVSGVLTVDKGYIASYNGETLPSTWISDRDVYAEGTSPTTGAQVVYELATPQTYQLNPTAVKSLLGTNNIWTDTGDIIEGEYFKGAESSETENIYYIKNIRIECEVI